MQARAYDGYFENGQFFPQNTPIRLPGRFRAVLTVVLEEPIESEPTGDWVDELNRLLEESGDEKLSMENFPRMDFGREPIIFND